MPAARPHIPAAAFRFLRDLRKNNNRQWFIDNKARYERDLRQPCLELIAALAAPLHKISEHYVADPKPMGGSLFRIHRDTRFSADKSPYKTHTGMSFYHAATKAVARDSAAGNANFGRLDAPVFYLHLEPGNCFIGGGLWHPQPQSVKRVRNYICNNPASWKRATQEATFRKVFTLDGETLSRPPQGYDPKHELIEDLKRKDFVCMAPIGEDQLAADDAVKTVMRHFTLAAPLVDWLCGALDLEF